MIDDTLAPADFRSLSLIPPVLQALDEVGYESPSPIQAMAIPPLLAGRDLLGQAQTGTGKTAAFALPLLSRINLKHLAPQALVLVPTRELAIQVSEAFQRYASHMQGFHVLPVYGGQEYGVQLRQLKRGTHVVVGTPGRVMDHMRRGTLKLDAVTWLVLDEADEMLRMGFIDAVEWVLEQTPADRQVALFSATLPEPIRRIAKKHLKNPEEITIKVRTTTAESIRQRYWPVSGVHKLDALTRILEAEDFDGMLIFVRTKIATTELAEKLSARGYAVAALNGDVPQKQRERTVESLKSGALDILVATDVAARGLDVERISHVVNYDVPHDTESYVHRIGRTGRFGRKGEAILFIAPRERHMLQVIERATRQKIEQMGLPSTEMLNEKRINQFMQRITDTLAGEQLDAYCRLIERYQLEHAVSALDVAAALARLLQGDAPLVIKESTSGQQTGAGKPRTRPADRPGQEIPVARPGKKPDRKRPVKEGAAGDQMPAGGRTYPGAAPAGRKEGSRPRSGMERFRLEAGRKHGVRPGDIVEVMKSEAGLAASNVDQITLHEDYSTVDLPEGMPREIFRNLKNLKLSGRRLNISRMAEPGREAPHRGRKFGGGPQPGGKRPAGRGRRGDGGIS